MGARVFAVASLAALLTSGVSAQDTAAQSQPNSSGQAPSAQAETQDATTTPMAAPAPSASMGMEMDARSLVGNTVYGRDEQVIGKVEDVVLDPQTNTIRQLVIGPYNGSGIGRKMVVVEMEEIQVRPEQGIRLSGLTRDDVAAMPDVNPDNSAVSLGKPTERSATGTEPTATSPTEPGRKP